MGYNVWTLRSHYYSTMQLQLGHATMILAIMFCIYYYLQPSNASTFSLIEFYKMANGKSTSYYVFIDYYCVHCNSIPTKASCFLHKHWKCVHFLDPVHKSRVTLVQGDAGRWGFPIYSFLYMAYWTGVLLYQVVNIYIRTPL